MTKSKFTLGLLIGFLATQANAVVPTLALTWDTNVRTYSMTSSQEAKIQKAEYKIRKVLASEEFRLKVLNHTYGGVKRFVDNGGLSNSQIYYKMLNGAEKLNGVSDNEMDMWIKTYYSSSNTVGYTSTGSNYVYMNRKFLNSYTSTQVTRNMIHEWLHKLGFKHAVSYSTSRNYSVPYGIGRIMETLAAKY